MTFPWGEELVQEVVDPDAAALTTTYTYYEDPAEDYRYRKLLSVVRPDGSWEKYDYYFARNLYQVLRPWKDLALASATTSNSLTTRYYYYYSDGFDVSNFARTLGITEEYVEGKLVRAVDSAPSGATVNGQPAIVQTETTNASPSVNQSSKTTRYHASAAPLLATRVASIEYPDGRKDTFSYEKGIYTPNVNPELSVFTPDVNGKAERDTVVHGTVLAPDGVAFKTTKKSPFAMSLAILFCRRLTSTRARLMNASTGR